MDAIFAQLNDEGHTIIVVTHDGDIARRAGRIVKLRDGLIVEDQAVVRRGSSVSMAD